MSRTSNNPSVATVNSSGLATGKGGGQVNIKAVWTTVSYEEPPQPCGPLSPQQTNLPDPCGCSSFAQNVAPKSPLLVVPNVDVSEIGFTGDYKITRWADGVEIDSPDGSAPTWKRTNNPNHPVAYTRGTNVTMFAKLKITPALSANMTATIQVWDDNNLIATKSNVTLSGSEVQVTAITTSAPLENAVRSESYGFRWEIIYTGGTISYPIGLSGPHLIHWTWSTPISFPFRNDAGMNFLPLYDKAFEESSGHANGATDLNQIINNISEGVDSDVFYRPTISIGGTHPLNAYTVPDGCQCSDHANLLRGLLRTIGINATTLYLWAGSNSSTISRYVVGSEGGVPFYSFRVIRAAHDGAPLNPHFSYHAVVSANGKLYDPSYGLSYFSLTFDETAFNNTPQQVSSVFWTANNHTNFVCPH